MSSIAGCPDQTAKGRYHCYQRWGDAMPDLLVRGVDDALVQALNKRAGAHGRSQEAELRVILAAELLSPPRRNLAAMPDVDVDSNLQH